MEFLKKYLLDILAIVIFAVISFAYFFPADMEGRILFQHDSSAGRGAGQEATEYYQKTGERTRWTNSLFSGMPTYQTSPSYKSTDILAKVIKAYHLWLPENVWYVFVYLLGFYILLRAFDFRKELAILGSIIWAFSSYFFIIIARAAISIYLDRGQLVEASSAMKIYDRESGLFDENGEIAHGYELYYYDKGRYMLYEGKLDSSITWFRRAIKAGKFEGGYKGLMLAFDKKGMKDSVVKYAESFANANDLSYINVEQKLIHVTASMYDAKR